MDVKGRLEDEAVQKRSGTRRRRTKERERERTGGRKPEQYSRKDGESGPSLSRHSSDTKDAPGREAWRHRTDLVDEAGEDASWKAPGAGLWFGGKGDMVVGRQLLEDERMQDGLAKNDGQIGRPNRQHMGMELKEESLWWTSTYAKEMDEPMVISSGGQLWVVPFVRKCYLLGYI